MLETIESFCVCLKNKNPGAFEGFRAKPTTKVGDTSKV
jgi:hypothetical protein